MFVMHQIRRMACATAAATLLVSAPALAQDKDPNPGAMTLTASFDFLNQYMFRGIRQNSSGIAMWPAVDLGIATYSGKGGLKSLGINLGTWNSLHTGDTGSDGPSGKLWYESDFYASLGFGFGGGTSFTTTYTSYTSPNGSYSTVKEIMFKLAVDDSAHLGKGAVKPYIVVARELSAEIDGLTNGQADGGLNAGTYMEIGGAPSYAGKKASVAIPIKAGFSLGDYYELAGVDNKFGYFSIAAIGTVPLGGTTNFGAWNLHGGVEYQRLGTTTQAFNGGEKNQIIGSIGIGFTY
ncbi:MAG TPA: hypothetical protein VH436_11415 [Vicinamibacterales bacterium]|jgi:hypothetical protein